MQTTDKTTLARVRMHVAYHAFRDAVEYASAWDALGKLTNAEVDELLLPFPPSTWLDHSDAEAVRQWQQRDAA